MNDLVIEKFLFLISLKSRDFPTHSGCYVDRCLSSFENFMHLLDSVSKQITH